MEFKVKYNLSSEKDIFNKLIYLDYLNKKEDSFEYVLVDQATARRHVSNLFGLFKALGIPDELLFYNMYINDYTSPYEYDGKKVVFKIIRKIDYPSS
ncbi:MAG: hypothetical protein QXF12_01360 [Candidatus Aenigmatarchaeota archaeon]